VVAGQTVATYAALIADPSRATMCLVLLDGRAWTAGELGRAAGIGASTASEHLSLLVRAGLLTEERQGRHRYLRLAGPDVAHLLEDLAGVAGSDPPPTSLRGVRARRELVVARTCYDHLAGRLGVAVHDAMVALDLVSTRDGVALTADGKQWLADFGATLDDASRRPVVRTCVDWTERRHHLRGQAAAAFLQQVRERGWVTQRPGSRAVAVTPSGAQGFEQALGIDAGVVLSRDSA